MNPNTLTSEKFAQFLKNSHSFQTATHIYHIAIIDYLQEWNLNKKAERFIKTILLNKDG
jgi:hypothetical protein